MKQSLNLITVLVLLLAAQTSQAADKSLADALSGQVVIHRDEFGVPHIIADTQEAAAYGYGYAFAEDRAEDYLRLLLKTRSQEAMYFGDKYAEGDLQTLQFGVYASAEEGYADTAPWFRRILDGYALGFNRFLEKKERDFPDWVTPITGVDVLAHAIRVCHIEFALDLGQASRLKATLMSEGTAITPGSNMMAINSERSATGNAMLLGNPHLLWSGSHIWHEHHEIVEGQYNAYGACLPGTPSINLGFNEHLGWSHTVNPHDNDDLYELTVDPENPDAYLYDGRPEPFRKETLSVQALQEDGSLVNQSREFWYSHHGPVLVRTAEKAYAMRSPGFNAPRLLEQWYLMSRADSFESFQRALEIQAISMFNICYADISGNCYFIFNGRYPERPRGIDWSGIVAGNTSATEWFSETTPVNKLPQLFNPPGGYVQNSNSAPWYTNLNAILDKTQFDPYLCPDNNDLRQQLGLLMLEADDSITFEELAAMKNTMRLLLAERLKEEVVKALEPLAEKDKDLRDARDVLNAWDNQVAPDSRGAVLFLTFWEFYEREAKPAWAVNWDAKNPVTTPSGLGDPGAVEKAMGRAVKRVRQAHDALDVAFGDVYRIREGKVDLPVGGFSGNEGAYRVLHYMRQEDGKYTPIAGDSYVFVVEFSDPPHAVSIMPYGQTDLPGHPHDDDQAPIFARAEWKPVYFTREAVEQNAKRTYRP